MRYGTVFRKNTAGLPYSGTVGADVEILPVFLRLGQSPVEVADPVVRFRIGAASVAADVEVLLVISHRGKSLAEGADLMVRLRVGAGAIAVDMELLPVLPRPSQPLADQFVNIVVFGQRVPHQGAGSADESREIPDDHAYARHSPFLRKKNRKYLREICL